MSRSLPWNGRALAALACAATLGLAPVASADTCTGLSLTALTPTAVGTTPVAVAVGDFGVVGRERIAGQVGEAVIGGSQGSHLGSPASGVRLS